MNKTYEQSYLSPRVVFGLIIATLVLVMAVKYNGIDMRYRALLLFYKNPDLLLNDWFFTDSIYLSGSYYYDLFALSRLPVHNNLMAVFLYVLFSSAAL